MRFLSALLGLVLVGAPQRVNAQGMPVCAPTTTAADVARRLDAALRDAQARGFSGAVLVEQKGQVILCRGYGWTDSTRAHPATPHTLYFIASMTKQITAAGILQLEQSGSLQRGDTLGRFFRGLPRRSASITLQQLLTHTAGLRRNYLADPFTVRDSAVLAVLGDTSNIAPPGRFNYTNDAYAVLAGVIEVVSGKSWEDFTRRNLLAPAQMLETSFWGSVNDRDKARFAQKQFERPAMFQQPLWAYRGSSGLWSNVHDLYHWYRFAWRANLLSQRGRDLLLNCAVTTPSGTRIGLGGFCSTSPRGTTELWIRGTEDFGHSGVLRWFPEEDFLVIVLSNAGSIDGRPANQMISDRLVQLITSSK